MEKETDSLLPSRASRTACEANEQSRSGSTSLRSSPWPCHFKLKMSNLILALLLTCSILTWFNITAHTTDSSRSPQASLEHCAWDHLQGHVNLLDVEPIAREEFLKRQAILAAALDVAEVDAFIAEPSASTSYFANISSAYELSERPFLMIIDRKGQFSYLVPKFEANRIAGLAMVYEEKRVIQWAEEESPYEVLKRNAGYEKIMLDEHARFMIAAGLRANGIEVVPMSQTIQSLRAVKSKAELAILRGINEFTVELVRSVQPCIKVGMTQSDISLAANALFSKAGVGAGVWNIILFGEGAANPHGGTTGSTLQEGEFVLIDIGSSLHGYGSDVTRTILPTGSKVSKELLRIWQLVFDAQTAGIERSQANQTCSDVDKAARSVIENEGYGDYFTHRLGHGLGLEMHEHPYLNGVNAEKLQAGNVVTNEPGIYVTPEQAKALGKEVGFGVRHEDPVLVAEDGGIVLTGSRAQSPYKP